MHRYLLSWLLGLVLGILGTLVFLGLLDEKPSLGHVESEASRDWAQVDSVGGDPIGRPDTTEMPVSETQSTNGSAPDTHEASSEAAIEPWALEALRTVPRFEPRFGEGVISGRITEPDGRPVAGIEMRAMPEMPDDVTLTRGLPHGAFRRAFLTERWNEAQMRIGVSDADGYYRVERLVAEWQYRMQPAGLGYRLFGSSGNRRLTPDAEENFRAEPQVSLTLTLQVPAGIEQDQFRICYTHDGETQRTYQPTTNPVLEINLPYEPDMEVWVVLGHTDWETEHLTVPATNARPVPAIVATLTFQPPPGITATLRFEPHGFYPDMAIHACFPLEPGEVFAPSIIGSRSAVDHHRGITLDPNTYVISDDGRMGPGTRQRADETREFTANYPHAVDGRFAIVVYSTGEGLYILSVTVVEVTEGNPAGRNPVVDVPPVRDEDCLRFRLQPPPDETLGRIQTVLTFQRRDGEACVHAFMTRQDDGLWRVMFRREFLHADADRVHIMLRLQDHGYAEYSVDVPVAELDRVIDVPLVRGMPFTLRVTNPPTGFPFYRLDIAIHLPSGQWHVQRFESGPTTTVTGVSTGRYEAVLRLHAIPLTTMFINVTAPDQVVDVMLPTLHSLSIRFTDQAIQQGVLRRVKADDTLEGLVQLRIIEGEARVEFLPPGTYRLECAPEGREDCLVMHLDVFSDRGIEFQPE